MAHDLPDSFEALFFHHYPVVIRKIDSIIHDRVTAEDLAQEVFLRLYRNPPDDISRVGPWLQRTLTRVAYDFLRQAVRRRNLTDRLEQTTDFGNAPSSESTVLKKLDGAVMADALARLSERDRQVLLLRQAGYSYAEVAQILGVNPDTVGTLVHRANHRLKKAYESQEGWSDEQSAGRQSGREPGLGAV